MPSDNRLHLFVVKLWQEPDGGGTRGEWRASWTEWGSLIGAPIEK